MCLCALFVIRRLCCQLEVLLCGLNRVDIEDWKSHTEFRGETNELHAKHDLVVWFFECCEEMTDAQRSKLLQWCTGCARVPIEGFVALQSHDGTFARGFAVKTPRCLCADREFASLLP